MFSLLSKYNRGIAWFFAIVLYLELIAVPLAAQAESALWFHGTYGLVIRNMLEPLCLLWVLTLIGLKLPLIIGKNFSPVLRKKFILKRILIKIWNRTYTA